MFSESCATACKENRLIGMTLMTKELSLSETLSKIKEAASDKCQRVSGLVGVYQQGAGRSHQINREQAGTKPGKLSGVDAGVQICAM